MIGARHIALVTTLSILLVATCARAQWKGHDGWVEETNGKTLKDDPGHSYLDPASVHRGDDGLVYFNEISGVTKPEQIGNTGFMKNAYDCARDLPQDEPQVRRSGDLPDLVEDWSDRV